jgi:energy-converting hydrogenase A subunit M
MIASVLATSSSKKKMTTDAQIKALFVKGKPMTSQIMFVTVDMAKELLKNRNPKNRSGKHVERNIKRLEKAILSGKFRFTHQPIAIDENGMLLDGHCRLEALIRAASKVKNLAIPFLIIRNAPLDTYVVLDSGKNRTVVDRAQEGGRYYTSISGRAAKRALFGMKSNKVIDDCVLLDLVEVHEENLRTMDEFMKSKRRNRNLRNVSRGGVLGALLRFSYTATYSQFTEVLEVLSTGVASASSENNVDAIVDFVDYLNEIDPITGELKIYGGGQAVENSLYRKTEVALNCYLNKTDLVKGTSTKTELFPFPDDKNKEHQKVVGNVYGKSLIFA